MLSLFIKIKGDGASLPVKPSMKNIALAWLGGYTAISALFFLHQSFEMMLLLASFGASCLLVFVFGFPDIPFSQPTNRLRINDGYPNGSPSRRLQPYRDFSNPTRLGLPHIPNTFWRRLDTGNSIDIQQPEQE